MLDYLKNNKRYWIPPILVFLAVILWVAYKASTVSGSPFEYGLR